MTSTLHSIDIGTAEVKLSCPLPDTNPPSTAVRVLDHVIYKHGCDCDITGMAEPPSSATPVHCDTDIVF